MDRVAAGEETDIITCCCWIRADKDVETSPHLETGGALLKSGDMFGLPNIIVSLLVRGQLKIHIGIGSAL